MFSFAEPAHHGLHAKYHVQNIFAWANANFSCRTVLPVTQAIRMGASCFGLAGKSEAIATLSSLAVNNGLTWKLSCPLPSRLFPVLQTNSWLGGCQCSFHLQLEDSLIWKLFWRDNFVLSYFGTVSKTSQDQMKQAVQSICWLNPSENSRMCDRCVTAGVWWQDCDSRRMAWVERVTQLCSVLTPCPHRIN